MDSPRRMNYVVHVVQGNPQQPICGGGVLATASEVNRSHILQIAQNLLGFFFLGDLK